AAGVKRLGLEEHIAAWLPPDRLVPAVSQGAVAVQVREGDEETRGWVGRLDHVPTRAATASERALLARLEGGCQVPVGALALVEGKRLLLNAVVCSLDGTRAVEGSREGSAAGAENVGLALAETLMEEGAESILEEIRARPGEEGS
ncbi:MAG: hydroxymethylbilane synthase, partial [bacterium]